MRKAFDTNVPKLKPRLRTAMVVVSEAESAPETPDERAGLIDMPSPLAAVSVAAAKEASPDPKQAAQTEPIENRAHSPVADETSVSPAESELQQEKILEFPVEKELEARPKPQAAPSSRLTAPVLAATPLSPAGDMESRRERLEKIKRKVTEAARTEVRIEPAPEDPAQAAESVMGLVSDLETQFSRSRDMEKALRIDLEEAKTELARAATEGRVAAERLGKAEAQLTEKRKVLEEMLAEMNALEEERDQSVRRVQMLAAQDEERGRLLDELESRCAELEKELSESKAEDERLAGELEECMADNAHLRAVLSEVTRERDGLAKNMEHLIKERDELTESKKALEKVHQALAQARARLGN
jgi:DNA repair exonuclease SbcCD ATPase subunit